ncbi:hypothetical protein EOW77_0032225 [Bradyrhizobium yuanmingense]|uniref:hypothetical protein n=1 Tax=Bradyrhizobium yuanmingense TaxID=108015 RepID=UPI000FE43544|nr:hypothetical protein [Bradyrhizobium yuanmingense]TGN75937.1 hypothetical protein EOW77_0032225 [Bradyrhizobium yuanmingense]
MAEGRSMSNPPVIHLDERRASPAPATPKPAPKSTAGRQTKIIGLCVQYCQLLAAMDAGFDADPTSDRRFAAAGNHVRRAARILPKLVGLSPHMVAGAEPLNADELAAKAAVAQALYGFRNGEELEPDERLFMRFFAGEVAGHLTARADEAMEARIAARTA